MGYANVISMEEFKREKVYEEIKGRLHEEVDKWLEGLMEKVGVEGPTLEEIVEGVFSMRGELTGKIVEVLIGREYLGYKSEEVERCSGCGKELKGRGTYERTVETMVGEVKIERSYFWCDRCGEGFYALDEELGLSSRKKQWDIQRRGVSLSTSVPYKEAEGLFGELSGVSISDHTLHEIVGEVGSGLGVMEVSPTIEEIREKIEDVSEGKKWRPILVLAVDGADVPTRPPEAKGKRRGRKRKRAKRAKWKGQYKEAKGFRLYLVDRDRIKHLLCWHQVQTDKELEESLREVKEAGLIPEDKVRLCVVADGAKWIWKVVKKLFPEAVLVLDWYHCSEHLHKVASLQYGHDPERQTEWIEATVTRLFCGEVQEVISDLQRMKPYNQQAEKEIANLVVYLDNNKARVDYGSAKKGGYPLGSGAIESSNKLIGHLRLKRPGAWWYVEKANEILALRCAKYNGTFNKVFQLYQQKARLKHSSTAS